MNKDIKDFLPLYLGVHCRFRGQELKGKINQENLWKLFSVTQMDYGLKANLFAMGCVQSLDAKDVYPLLRPLSDMTEEEAKKLASTYTGYHITYVLIKGRQIVYNYYHGDEVQENVLDIEYSNPKGFLYMLSKHFDLFGLIESGLAIDKTKPNKEPEAQESDTRKV